MTNILTSECTIEGFESNSTSPTDVWVLTLNIPIVYNDYSIQKLFVKISINKSNEYELKYEINIYDRVIKKIFEYKLCPFFIQHIDYKIGCSYTEILEFLKGKVVLNNTVLSDRQTTSNFNRNISIIYNNNKNRPAINDNILLLHINHLNTQLLENLTFNLLINESINSLTTKTLERTLVEIMNNPLTKNKKNMYYNIISQIAVACYVLEQFKLIHNDLHFYNVYVEYTSSSTNQYIYQKINDTVYKIKSDYKIKIYDFDRSYIESLGPNYVLNGYLCNNFGTCNKVFPNTINRDFLYILRYIFVVIPDRKLIDKILSVIYNKTNSKPVKFQEDFDNLFTNYNANPYKLFYEFYNKYSTLFYDTETVIKRLSKLKKNINFSQLEERIPNSNIYECNSNMFDNNGDLKITCNDN